MAENKLIAIKPETKNQLDNLKLCQDESYNSMLQRVLPEWMRILKTKLKNEEEPKTLRQPHEETNSS